jgi:hypothetical protein
MRPKVVFVVLLFTLAMVGAIIFWKQHSAPVALPASEPPPVATTMPTPEPAKEPMPVPSLVSTSAPVVPRALSPKEHEAVVDAEVERLSNWAMNNDPESLSNIVNDLVSPEKDIRVAAINAAKQFESPDAIPALKAAAVAAVNAGNGQEAVDMLEAADWLALPTVEFRPSGMGNQQALTPEQTQALEKNRAEAQSRRQDYLQKRAQLKGSQPQSGTQSAPGQNSGSGSK